MMNDAQTSLRFVIPGVAACAVTATAFAITFPGIAEYFGGLEFGGWILAVIESGAIGFVLSQAYFAFWPQLDYRHWFRTHTECAYLRSLPVRARPQLTAAWCTATQDRVAAYKLGTFLWQTRVATASSALDESTGRAAARMAAVGATLIGTALGALAWLIAVACLASPWCLLVCSARIVVSALTLGTVLVTLWRTHQRRRNLDVTLVEYGLSTHAETQEPENAGCLHGKPAQ